MVIATSATLSRALAHSDMLHANHLCREWVHGVASEALARLCIDRSEPNRPNGSSLIVLARRRNLSARYRADHFLARPLILRQDCVGVVHGLVSRADREQ